MHLSTLIIKHLVVLVLQYVGCSELRKVRSTIFRVILYITDRLNMESQRTRQDCWRGWGRMRSRQRTSRCSCRCQRRFYPSHA